MVIHLIPQNNRTYWTALIAKENAISTDFVTQNTDKKSCLSLCAYSALFFFLTYLAQKSLPPVFDYALLPVAIICSVFVTLKVKNKKALMCFFIPLPTLLVELAETVYFRLSFRLFQNRTELVVKYFLVYAVPCLLVSIAVLLILKYKDKFVRKL